MIDESDELYASHQALMDADAAFYLIQLLRDESEAVALKAAATIAALADHSSASRARLAAVGLESSVEKVLLNPVQQEIIDQGG